MLVRLVTFCSLLTIGAFGQSSDSAVVRHYYEQNTILWPGGKFYFKGSTRYPFKHLKEELKISKEAFLEYKEYVRANRRMFISIVALEVSAIGLLFAEEPPLQIGLLVTAATMVPLSGIYGRQALAHLQRAIWVYNRDVLLK